MPEVQRKAAERKAAEHKVAEHGDDVQDFAYLGREFLTWLVWRVDLGEATFGDGDEAFSFTFGGRVRLGALAGDVSDAVLKGPAPALGIEVRSAVGAGRTLKEAELRATQGDREWRFTLVGETLDLKGVKLPALLTEEDDEKLLERLSLLEELDDLVKTAYGEFLRERTRPAWRRTSVPAIRRWIAESLAVD